MTTYVVPFDDEDCIPWVKIINANNINEVEDQIINYVLDNFEFDKQPPLEYHNFVEYVAKEGLFIGKILEIEDY